MKIRFIVGLTLLTLLLTAMYAHMAQSEEPWWMSFSQEYEPNILYPKIDLEVKVVENADAECSKYAKDINYEIEHCALQWKPQNGVRKCTLIMQRDKITMGDLGHELRHCLEGDWHDARPTERIKLKR